jgi:hypothetical protein
MAADPVLRPAAARDRFPDWARVLIGIVLAVLSYLASSQTFDEEIRGALAAGLVAISAAGVIPPLPQTLRMSKPVAITLTVIVAVAGYVLNVSVSIDPDLRGIILAALTVLATVGIRPPQVAGVDARLAR